MLLGEGLMMSLVNRHSRRAYGNLDLFILNLFRETVLKTLRIILANDLAEGVHKMRNSQFKPLDRHGRV